MLNQCHQSSIKHTFETALIFVNFAAIYILKFVYETLLLFLLGYINAFHGGLL